MKHSLELNIREFEELFKNYNIGHLLSFDNKSKSFDSGVYFFQTTNGKYVLKIFNHSNIKKIQYQNSIINFLSDKNVPVPINIQNNQKEEFTKLNGKLLLIQKFVEGKEAPPLTLALIKDMANNFANMHKALLKFNYCTKRKFKKYALLKFPIDAKYDYINKYQRDALNNLNKLPESELRKSHIHGDISCVNFLARNNKLQAIIDWEEAHYGILVYDHAIFIAQNFIRSDAILKTKIELFMNEYQNTIKLNNYEKKAMYYLIRYRLVKVLHWYINRQGKFKTKPIEFKEGINKSFSRIHRFDNFPIKNFLL